MSNEISFTARYFAPEGGEYEWHNCSVRNAGEDSRTMTQSDSSSTLLRIHTIASRKTARNVEETEKRRADSSSPDRPARSAAVPAKFQDNTPPLAGIK